MSPNGDRSTGYHPDPPYRPGVCRGRSGALPHDAIPNPWLVLLPDRRGTARPGRLGAGRRVCQPRQRDGQEDQRRGGSKLEPQSDGSIRVSGENPAKDVHRITLRTNATDMRLVMLEALPEPTAPDGKIGRAPNGNAVLSGITVEAVSVADPTRPMPVLLNWAWADVSQQNGDFDVTNALAADPARGRAVGAHMRPGGRVALFAAQDRFGFEGGTDLRIELRYESIYDQHTLARVRLSVGSISDAGLNLLPPAPSRWYVAGPFQPGSENRVYEPSYGPEEGDVLDFKRRYGPEQQSWRFGERLADGQVVARPDGRNVTIAGRYIYTLNHSTVEMSLGSEDEFLLKVNGEKFASRVNDIAYACD